MAPTKLYVKPVLELLKTVPIHGMSHITGDGITGNLPRVFPKHLAAQIKLNTLPKTKLFDWAKTTANLSDAQMLETFNCGIGYVIIINPQNTAATLKTLSEQQIEAHILGSVIENNNIENQIIYV